MEWKNIFRGMLMGISDVVPGVSGGTIAFILGIYDRLIEAISGFFSKEWAKHLRFLLPLGVGMVAALLLFSHIIDFLIHTYPQQTQFLFLGLIIGVLPLLAKESQMTTTFTKRHYLALIIPLLLVASMAFLQESTRPVIETLTVGAAISLFFAGWLASMSMLLPGISGSLVLLILGFYTTAISALKSFNIPIILVIGAGVAAGFILSSKAIKYLLIHYPKLTFAAIIGLVMGSTAVVFPGFSASMLVNAVSILTFIIGVIIVQFIARTNERMVAEREA
jgi:putative membrane protein